MQHRPLLLCTQSAGRRSWFSRHCVIKLLPIMFPRIDNRSWSFAFNYTQSNGHHSNKSHRELVLSPYSKWYACSKSRHLDDRVVTKKSLRRGVHVLRLSFGRMSHQDYQAGTWPKVSTSSTRRKTHVGLGPFASVARSPKSSRPHSNSSHAKQKT